MLVKTSAIVLHHIPYSDSGEIVHLLTRDEGRITVYVRGRGKRAAMSPMQMQPFSLVDVLLDNRSGRSMQYVRECANVCPFSSIPLNPVKSAVTLFLTEVLYRTIREPQTDKHLYDFLEQSIRFYDDSDRGTANFHLVFLIKMTHFLGFFPNVSGFEPDVLFDLKSGCFTPRMPDHTHYLNPRQTEGFAQLLRMNYETMHLFSITRLQRQDILEQIMRYYRLHLPEFGQIRSLDILTELFD